MPLRLKEKKLNREQTLKARPIKNELVRRIKGENGQTVLAIPRKEACWIKILSKIFYIPEEKKLSLDEIGVWVWARCNGRNSVLDIIEGLSREFKISRKEAEVSLLSYLKKLAEKRLIGFIIK